MSVPCRLFLQKRESYVLLPCCGSLIVHFSVFEGLDYAVRLVTALPLGDEIISSNPLISEYGNRRSRYTSCPSSSHFLANHL